MKPGELHSFQSEPQRPPGGGGSQAREFVPWRIRVCDDKGKGRRSFWGLNGLAFGFLRFFGESMSSSSYHHPTDLDPKQTLKSGRGISRSCARSGLQVHAEFLQRPEHKETI